MNIDHVTTEFAIPTTSVIKVIFEKQHELEVKYGPIERNNGHYYPPHEPAPWIDDGQFQSWIKNMFWRATEEVAEAMEVEPAPEALVDWKAGWANDHNLRHFFEELADSVHFLTAVSLLTSLNWTDVHVQMEEVMGTSNYELEPGAPAPTLRQRCWDFIGALGLAANCLKNKPWKSTQMLTDAQVFRDKLLYAWSRMFVLWKSINASPTDLYILYCKKHEVNQFRQETNY